MNNSLQKNIIKPNQRFETGSIKSFFYAIKNLFRLRDMIYQLFRKDLFAVYYKSFIGSAWILLTPIAGIISWIFLHRANIISPGDVGIPYPAYILVGTMVWGLFMSITSAFMNAMLNSKHLLLWTYFPHEAVFGVQMLLRIVDFFISFLVTIIILVLFRIFPSWGIFLFPFVVLPLLFFAISIGLVVSIVSVVSYDLRKIVVGVLGLFMFIIPVIYSVDAIENIWIKKLIDINPLTYLVCSARDIILYGKLYSEKGFFISSAISIFTLFISWRIFYVSEDKIIERMI